MRFRMWTSLYIYSDSTEVCFQECNKQSGRIGSDNVLVHYRRQTIIQSNIHTHICVTPFRRFDAWSEIRLHVDVLGYICCTGN